MLVLTIITVVVMSLVDFFAPSDGAWVAVFSTAVLLVIGLTMLLALGASGVARIWRRAIAVFVALVAVYTLFVLMFDLAGDSDLRAVESHHVSPIWLLLAAVTPVAVVRRLLKHRRITAGTMYGAVSAYLLIATGFAYAFLYLNGVQDDPFFVEVADPPSTSFMYFSLVSVTTLGYGDLSAYSALGRLLATSEAVIGQVYLVTFVALLVGLLIQQRGERGSQESTAGAGNDDEHEDHQNR